MSVVIETTLGDITVDLYLEQRPVTCLNFLKLCKMKYYNFNLFHSIRSGFIAQTGDPTAEGSGGQSIFGLLEGPEKRFFSGEKLPKIRHTNTGTLSMVGTGDMMVGSQFFFTLAPDLDSLDNMHCVIGEVTEGHDILRMLNDVICDENHRPYRDVRITHTVVLEDPFNDPVGLRTPSRSPSPSAERLKGGRIAPDEDIDEAQGKSAQEIQELIEEKEAKARATILEIVGDLPDADIAPPENVLFVCKLNPVTTDEDLEIIFSRFGKIVGCEVIRDKKSGDSLQYAFIEFSDKKSCEDAYFKMDNVLIDDRRIHVDFSQSVSRMRWMGKGKGIKYYNNNEPKEQHLNNHSSQRQHNKDRDGGDYNNGRVEDSNRKRHESRESDHRRYKNEREIKHETRDKHDRHKKGDKYRSKRDRSKSRTEKSDRDRSKSRTEKSDRGRSRRNRSKSRTERSDRDRSRRHRSKSRTERNDRDRSRRDRSRSRDEARHTERSGKFRKELSHSDKRSNLEEIDSNTSHKYKSEDKKSSKHYRDRSNSTSCRSQSKLETPQKETLKEQEHKKINKSESKVSHSEPLKNEPGKSNSEPKSRSDDELQSNRKRSRSNDQRHKSDEIFHINNNSEKDDSGQKQHKHSRHESSDSDKKTEVHYRTETYTNVKSSEKDHTNANEKQDIEKANRKTEDSKKSSKDTKKQKHGSRDSPKKEKLDKNHREKDPRTPTPIIEKNDKSAKKLHSRKKTNATNSKKKRKHATSSSESSSDSSSSTESSSSSEEDRKKKALKRRKKKVSTSSSSSSSSTSSSSSSSTDSSSSSSSSDSEPSKKKRKKNVSGKVNKSKRAKKKL